MLKLHAECYSTLYDDICSTVRCFTNFVASDICKYGNSRWEHRIASVFLRINLNILDIRLWLFKQPSDIIVIRVGGKDNIDIRRARDPWLRVI